MSDSKPASANRAVFLSYASQDAEAAKRICEALRAAGVEVWFDQSELVGGDAWDAKIRGQIASCALFVPVISANTQARLEGYFRLEWKLAAQRTHTMAEEKTFLLPVVIDATRDADAKVPAEFKAVQWTRLGEQDASAALVNRVVALLGGERAPEKSIAASPTHRRPGAPIVVPPQRRRLAFVWTAVALVAAGAGYLTLRPRSAAPHREPSPDGQQAALTPARQFLAQARVLLDRPTGARVDLDAAGQLLDRALALDSTDPDIIAASAQVDIWSIYNRHDRSPARREAARAKSARALALAPKGFEPQLAQANYFVRGTDGVDFLPDAERILTTLHGERPRDLRVLHALSVIYRAQRRDQEAMATFAKLEALPGGPNLALSTKAWLFEFRGRRREAEETVDRALVLEPAMLSNIVLKILLLQRWHGDLDRARDFVAAMPAAARLEDWGAYHAYDVYLWRREPEQALQTIDAVPREWLDSINFAGPKALLTGDARLLLKRTEAARADFQRALALIEARLATASNDPLLLTLKARALRSVGERDAAARIAELAWEATNRGQATSSGGAIQTRSRRPAGDITGVLDNLEASALEPLTRLSAAQLRLDPGYDYLRDQPRFQALLARLEADPRFSPRAKR